MIELPCPWCGPRNVAEFRYVGERKQRPDPATVAPAEWRRYLYTHRNPCGWTDETWFHGSGCRRYFGLRRHTGTNEIAAASTVEEA